MWKVSGDKKPRRSGVLKKRRVKITPLLPFLSLCAERWTHGVY
jgi:hypothetical protein